MTGSPDVHTLTGPYVLDALPDDERRDFEHHLLSCAACTTEVTELREAVVKLSTQVAIPPPARLKALVLASISRARQVPPLVGRHSAVPSGVAAPRRWSKVRSMLALAAAVLAAATSGGIAIDQYRDKSELARTNDQVAAVLAEPDVRTVHGDVSGGGQATVVASRSRDAAVVVLRGLRPLPPGRSYQLWLTDGARTAHSVGVVDSASAAGLTTVITGGVAGKVAFGLTIEPDGGSARPTLPSAALISMV
ncbi:hypothetical protein Kfla_1487 [Kribbella flavida DSM 17836]|uniref:Regulator of SigK n=1 Tax=Kribbella flavida (strain DSM 17836 / JCM 10339 / NBRC 14399) TaxID=479435 RepID=D2PLF8_KRIFD|nr:anti-sigma factor [Kribbella flavida]ADB30587.1 hypothetical protein Kfla_1487 [Kribbella flavida DSM 17836]